MLCGRRRRSNSGSSNSWQPHFLAGSLAQTPNLQAWRGRNNPSPSPSLQWEELQAAARAAEAAGQDPWSALQQQGVQCSEGAFVYLSPAQLAALEAELATASAAMDVIRMEAAAYFVSDCLLRARVANNRMPTSAGRWG